jgi:hypothetical protein
LALAWLGVKVSEPTSKKSISFSNNSFILIEKQMPFINICVVGLLLYEWCFGVYITTDIPLMVYKGELKAN